MIATIIDVSLKENRIRPGTHRLEFKVLDDYEQKHKVPVSIQTLEYFEKANGIYWGDREPSLNEYIGMIISVDYDLFKGKKYLTAFGPGFWKKVNKIERV